MRLEEENCKEDLYRPIKDINSNEWRIRINNELELIFHNPTYWKLQKVENYSEPDMIGVARIPYYA